MFSKLGLMENNYVAQHSCLCFRRPAAAYAVAFWTVEAVTGELLRRIVGDVPWGEDYRRHPDQLGGGLIRLSYAGNWALAGLALEQLAPLVRRIELRPPAVGHYGGCAKCPPRPTQ